MEDIVQVLDAHTANQIAAGEVVERPASVVKELVENAIDAASRNIEVEIAGGGCESIRISDDGWGMSAKDAQTAMLRHATSKIRSADDLYHIASLGFRGEALPSIASVSRFTLTTRRQEDALATQIVMEGSQTLEVTEAGGGVGTTILVRDIFFNLPARLKFLKKPATESAQIHDIITRLALSHPEVAFRLINNQRLVLSTNGSGRLEDVIASLYGREAGAGLLELTHAQEGISLQGFLGQPTLLRSSRQWQTFLVNGRVVQSRALSKALDNAYHSVLPKTGFPLAVIRIDVPAEDIDVNVHPQKSEVKFKNEQDIFRAVYKAVTVCLTRPAAEQLRQAAPLVAPRPKEETQAFDFQNLPSETVAAQPEKERPTQPAPLPAPYRPIFKPLAERQRPVTAAESIPVYETPPAETVTAAPCEKIEPEMKSEPARTEILQAVDATMMDEDCQAESRAPLAQATISNETEAAEPLQVLGQVLSCYIVAKDKEQMYLVDQHAAHERILYDKFVREAAAMPGQTLLVPVYLEVDEKEEFLLEQHGEALASLGFRLEMAGPGTARLLELPADLTGTSPETMLRELLVRLDEMQQPTAAQLRHMVFETAACHAAIRAGEELNQRQMERLLEQLAQTTLPYSCPHGRPVMVRFGEAELMRWFKRT